MLILLIDWCVMPYLQYFNHLMAEPRRWIQAEKANWEYSDSDYYLIAETCKWFWWYYLQFECDYCGKRKNFYIWFQWVPFASMQMFSPMHEYKTSAIRIVYFSLIYTKLASTVLHINMHVDIIVPQIFLKAPFRRMKC